MHSFLGLGDEGTWTTHTIEVHLDNLFGTCSIQKLTKDKQLMYMARQLTALLLVVNACASCAQAYLAVLTLTGGRRLSIWICLEGFQIRITHELSH